MTSPKDPTPGAVLRAYFGLARGIWRALRRPETPHRPISRTGQEDGKVRVLTLYIDDSHMSPVVLGKEDA